MHPLLAMAVADARRRELEALAHRRVFSAPRRRSRSRGRARVAVGTRLIGIGLRLVDLPANAPVGPDWA
jgi:hypothetical protein